MKRDVAFSGVKGGCANACVAYTLRNGHHAIALARSLAKLRQQLLKKEITKSMLKAKLDVVQGDVEDVQSVNEVLRFCGRGVDTVVSGIGGMPKPQLSLTRPLTMTDPTICSGAMETILQAIEQMALPQQPLLVVISANGVLDQEPRDYPLALTLLYRWMLIAIYDDKRIMESTLEKMRPSGAYLLVRPSVLNDEPSRGIEAIRQGTTNEPVQGWSISREDVGLWIYERVIKPSDRSSIVNNGFVITY